MIKRIWADHIQRGGTTIFWEVESTDEGPYVYTVYKAYEPFETWEVVTTIADSIGAIDYEENLHSVYNDLYYKVVLETAEGTYESHPARADGGLPKRDWLIAREVVRKEFLAKIKGLGVKGYLLKRRWWGERCRECTDYNTGDVVKHDCLDCYGTGIIGGYHDPFEFWAAINTFARTSSVRQGEGHSDPKDIQARFVAYPVLRGGDVWVNADSDERYKIGEMQPIQVSASIRSKPLVQTAGLGLVPMGDIIYSIPIGERSGSYEFPPEPLGSEFPTSEIGSSSEVPVPSSDVGCPYVGISF